MNEFNRSNWPWLPLGGPASFGVSVFDEPGAMRYYSSLSETERKLVQDDLRGMSRREAREYARNLAQRGKHI